MDTTCKVSVTESFVRRLASEASVAKFERFSLAKMIEEHRTGMLKKCRNPGCEMTIRVTRPEVGCLEVLCDSSLGGCGCLNCAVPGCWEEAHFPLDCKRVPDWQRKCNEDGGLSGWIKAGLAAAGEGQNTDGVKACPKCELAESPTSTGNTKWARHTRTHASCFSSFGALTDMHGTVQLRLPGYTNRQVVCTSKRMALARTCGAVGTLTRATWKQ
eukprot:COSAG06_NODE_2410_length_6922_cov_2.585813_3_plen_215_part_00